MTICRMAGPGGGYDCDVESRGLGVTRRVLRSMTTGTFYRLAPMGPAARGPARHSMARRWLPICRLRVQDNAVWAVWGGRSVALGAFHRPFSFPPNWHEKVKNKADCLTIASLTAFPHPMQRFANKYVLVARCRRSSVKTRTTVGCRTVRCRDPDLSIVFQLEGSRASVCCFGRALRPSAIECPHEENTHKGQETGRLPNLNTPRAHFELIMFNLFET